MENYNYTFIIPHKNIPELLTRCLNSIPEREDIQIIVIDDNSDPEKVDFVNFPGLKRKNTEIYFTKEGKGAGYARNIGLRHAKGKWLFFADADDFYNENLLLYIDQYKNCDSDIIYWGASSIDCYSQKRTYRSFFLNYYIQHKDKNKSEIWLRYKFGEPWSKMIRRSLVTSNTILFDEIPNHNDTMFSLLAGHYAKKIEINPYQLYCITVREGSISNKDSVEKLIIRINVFKRVEAFFKKNGIALTENRQFKALYELKRKNKFVYKQEYITLSQNYSVLHIELQLIKIRFEKLLLPLVRIRRFYLRIKQTSL